MKEKIYTIPVNDAFSSECECPICSMYKTLEDDAVSYTMGPSYMEDDIRALTDKKGFCQKHLKKVYDCENRLGFALVMKTHFDRVIADVEGLQEGRVAGKSMFKKADKPVVTAYTEELDKTCFVCERIENTFDRYIYRCIKNRVHHIEFTTTTDLDLKSAVANAGVQLSYSYKTTERTNYTLYSVTFTY